MAFYRCGGGGIPSSLKTDMNAVLNKKFGTSADYPPADWAPTVNLMGPLPEKTIVSSPIADFSDGADDVPTKSLVVTIPPTLSGVSSVTETQTGRNLFSYDLPLYEGYWLNGFQGTGNEVNYDTSNGWLFYKIPVKEGATITFSGMQAMGGVYCAFFKDTPDNVISTFLNGSINGARQVPTGANFVGVEINRGGSPQRDPKTEYPQAQLEFGSTAHAYEQYQTPTVYTASLGRTIYGGEVDIVNGVGTDENGNDFTFDGQEVNTRLGYNAFWSDSGDTEVTYRADINLALGGQ